MSFAGRFETPELVTDEIYGTRGIYWGSVALDP
jgi:hypothetical protein